MKWGMVIPNTTDLVINGRLEELCAKPFFRNLLESKRCVLAVNGYYEWTKEGMPYLISTEEVKCLIEDNKVKVTSEPQVLQFACLYNNTTKSKDQYNQFVTLTMPSTGGLSAVHTRMPVLLNEDTRKKWLDPKVSFEDCVEAINDSNVWQSLKMVQVSSQVNSIRN